MTTLSARYVKQPRHIYNCDNCGRLIMAEHIRLYGMGEREKPWTLRLHATERCCPNHSGDPKIAAALAKGGAKIERNEDARL